MGSATTQALAASTQALAAASGVSIDTARELFAAARAVGDSSHLSGALADGRPQVCGWVNAHWIISPRWGTYVL